MHIYEAVLGMVWLYISFQFFGAASYVALGMIYTAFTFSGELPKKEALIFSKQNMLSPWAVILRHMIFLTLLFSLFQCASFLDPLLPNWPTDETVHVRGGTFSFFEILLIIIMICIHYIERRLLYIDSEKADKD